MFTDVEEILGRELREVADGLHVPAMPPLPREAPRTRPSWQPMLVAAAVLVLVAGVVAALLIGRGGSDLQPAPSPEPTPSPTVTEAAAPIPTTAPTMPYVLNQKLYVGGEQVPGEYWSVTGVESGWIATSTDFTYWWGRGTEASQFTADPDASASISPNGLYVAYIENSTSTLTGFDTRSDGEGLGGVGIDIPDPARGRVNIMAVTDDGKVIIQGEGDDTSLMWLPLAGTGVTVDLNETAPDQRILGSTPAGLVVTDGVDGQPYLAQITTEGELTRTATLPQHDDIEISPGSEWLLWSTFGSTQGEVTEIPTLQAQTLDGKGRTEVDAPKGWAFSVRGYVWEDDEHIVSPVLRNGNERMARCGVQPGRCVLIDAP